MENILRELLTLAEEKQGQMQQFLAITKMQTDLLLNENVEGYLEQITLKQQIIERVDRLDAAMRELEERLNGASTNSSSRILRVKAETKQIIRAAVEVDNRNTALSRQLLEKLGQEMQEHQRSNQAAKAYIRAYADADVPSFYTNRKV